MGVAKQNFSRQDLKTSRVYALDSPSISILLCLGDRENAVQGPTPTDGSGYKEQGQVFLLSE